MRYTYSLLIRVVLSITLLLIPINIFKVLFEMITLNLTYELLKLANTGAIIGSYGVRNAIDILGGYTVRIVEYCVTASAYYLYTLFVILVHDVSITKRIILLILGYFAIFVMNIVRILILVATLVDKGPEYFSTAHDLFGVALSIFYVIVIWILFSLIMGIKHIPIITDVRILIGEILRKDEV